MEIQRRGGKYELAGFLLILAGMAIGCSGINGFLGFVLGFIGFVVFLLGRFM